MSAAPPINSQYRLSYELCPIILTNGIAANLPGGVLPIINLLGDASLPDSDPNANDYFAHFSVVPGGTLMDTEIADYPFANQSVAANATITRPLMISLLMVTPVKSQGGYLDKANRFTSLKSSLDAHTQAGGTYTVATPAYTYTDCILRLMTDVSSPNPQKPQELWKLDFVKPLVTLADAQTAQNALMGKISASQQTAAPAPDLTTATDAVAANGGVVDSALGVAAPAWSSVETAIGSPQAALGSIVGVSGGGLALTSNNLIGNAQAAVASALQVPASIPSVGSLVAQAKSVLP
jgi:hypothetical protein